MADQQHIQTLITNVYARAFAAAIINDTNPDMAARRAVRDYSAMMHSLYPMEGWGQTSRAF